MAVKGGVPEINVGELEMALSEAQDARSAYDAALSRIESIIGFDCEDLDLTSDDMVDMSAEDLIRLCKS